MLKLFLISDFNVATLAQFLNEDSRQPVCAASVAPFGQVVSPLMGNGDPGGDFAVVWTTPEKTSSAFGRALSFETVSDEDILSEVCGYAEYIKALMPKFRAVFLMAWTLPPYIRGYGVADLSRRGIRTLVMKMNLKLAEELQNMPGVYLLDAQKWIEAVGRNSYSPKLWYLVKSPFHPDVFKEATNDIKTALRGVMGESRRLIVLDLDNTLWGGTVGDLGWENVRLGGHDYVGEAFLDFQRALKALSRRGILLAIVSKNEESIALDALRNHPEMILRPDDFVGWRINWDDKAANLVELAAEVNIGLQSIVFIDDSPVERARVREKLPEVHVPEWPKDVTLFASYLLHMDCFDSPYSTNEDSSRTQLYAAQKQRDQFKDAHSSRDEWLCSLKTELRVEVMTEANRVRVVQLFNKTNQMNLRTRRMTEKELEAWLTGGNRKLWVFRVTDRFGDSGLTGILTLDIGPEISEISDFVLSCRVMGRDVEKAMISVAVDYCRTLNVKELRAEYLPSAKNAPCLQFWKNSGFECFDGNSIFTWALDNPYPAPIGVQTIVLADDLMNNVVSKGCGALAGHRYNDVQITERY